LGGGPAESSICFFLKVYLCVVSVRINFATAAAHISNHLSLNYDRKFYLALPTFPNDHLEMFNYLVYYITTGHR